MLSSYFPNKNYTFLYLHIFGEKIGNRLLEIFTGVIFYHLGMPLPFIILFFGLEFGLRGVLAPLSHMLVSRIGLKRAVVISYAFLTVFFVLVGLAKVSLILGFLSFIFQAISRAIYYPCIDTLHSVFVHNGTRGKQYTLELAITALAGLLAVGIGFTVLADAFLLAFISMLVFMTISIGAILAIERVEFPRQERFADSYRYLFSPEFKENWLPFGAESVVIIASVILAPVFIFVLVPAPASFSFIILIGILIEVAFALLYGLWIDKSGHQKTLRYASVLQALGYIGYIASIALPGILPLMNGFNNTTWDMFSSNYNTRIHQKAQKTSDPLLFNTASQMSLCFVEIVVLCIFALIAWRWGSGVFIVVFLVSTIGLYFSTHYFVD